MRLRRKRVILTAGALVLIWLAVVMLTPPPSSQATRRHYDDDDKFDDVAPKQLRTSYNAVKVGALGGREQDKKYVAKEFADFEDFQLDAGAQGSNTSIKSNKLVEAIVIKGGDLLLRNSNDSVRSIGDEKQTNSKHVNDQSALLEIEKDLVPKNVSVSISDPSAIWDVAASWVKSLEIYPAHAPQLGDVLYALSTAPILEADVGYKGTQLKARLTLQGGQMVVFKPKRFARDHIIYGKPYAGYDRHNGEIAAFHLDRVLDLRRAPLVAGRTVNLRTEIKPVATQVLLDTYITKDNNTCFYGKCYYCKPEEPACAEGDILSFAMLSRDTSHNNTCFYGKCYYCKPEEPACADGDIMEGSITLWLPKNRPLKKWRHLWSRTYKEGKKARWEHDNTYCHDILTKYPLNKYPIVLDMIDASVFDYLIGNADRHQYETFQHDGDQGMLLLLDNAKSFGNPHHDEKSILAPLYQCCKLRRTLWTKLKSLQSGALSNVMRQVLSHDPISPVLTDKHLTAMDRRLGHIITMVMQCFSEHGEAQVLQ